MFNNKTLKGLAISAVVALGFGAFVATPANAYGRDDHSYVTIAPSVGDEWNVLATSSFTVKATKTSLLSGHLKLLVEDVKSDTEIMSVSGTEAATSAPTVWTEMSGDRKSATDGSYVLEASVSNDVEVAFVVAAKNTKTLASASFAVKVTAWDDANGNGAIDATEYASSTETINFLSEADVDVAVALNKPFIGDSTLSAVVTTTPTLNQEMGASITASDLANVAFSRFGTATTVSYASVTWNATDRYYTFVSANLNTTDWGLAKTTKNSFSNIIVTASSKIVDEVLTVVTSESLTIRVGDVVSATTSDIATAATFTVSKIVSTKEFQATAPADTADATSLSSGITITNYANANDVVEAGTYGATVYWSGAKVGTSEFAPSTVVADEVSLNVAGSANVAALANGTGASEAVAVKKGTTAVDVVATVLDADGEAVGAGKVVVISNTGRSTDVKINGKTSAVTALTDANGQVTANVTSTAGASGTAVTLTFTAEGAVSSGVVLTWATQAFSLVDLSVTADALADAATRSILAGGSYVLEATVLDQWFQAPASTDTYRVKVEGTGAVNAILPVSAGKVSVTIGDNGLATSYATTLTLQKLGTTGTYTTVSTVTVDTLVKTGKVTLGADGTTLYTSTAVDLASDVAAKALVEADLRTSVVAIPAYANNAYVAGKVANATSNVAVNGAVVTITGPTSLLFNDGKVYKRGSITVVADANGEFGVKVYSTTAQKDTVVTVTSLGSSATTKLTFTGAGVGEGTNLVITAPDTVAPASTLQIKAKLTDVYGNAVEASAGRIKMTYTGAGIGFGTLPTSTDKNGELSYSVLLGAGDTGTITVVVSYDQNGDGDFVDTKDLNVTKTITVGSAAPAAAPAASADQKVNAGSFKGYVALYAKGYAGQKMTAVVAGKWLKVDSLASGFERVVRYTGAGYDIIVKIYIDGELEGTFNLTTK